MTDIKKWYSDWYSGEEELTDEEEQSLAELDMMVDKAIADERAKVLREVEELLIKHFAGSGELFFPYVGCGASSKAEEKEFAKQVILDALGRKRIYDNK